MNDQRSLPSAVITRLVGIYDADGTWRGELSYWVGARLGTSHCSLCEITHGRLREKSEWKVSRAELPVAFVTFHRDDQPDPLRALLGASLPAIVAETSEGPVLLLGPAQLEECAGDPLRLMASLSTAVRQRNMAWPAQVEHER